MATRGLVPRAANEGFVGTVDKPWGDGRIREFQSLRIMGRYTAAGSLSGQRAVVLTSGGVTYADAGNLAHAGAVLGMTNGAALLGMPIDIVEKGAVDDPAWTWTPLQPLYLRSSGVISGTPPSSGFSCQVGFALTATRVYVAVQPAVILI